MRLRTSLCAAVAVILALPLLCPFLARAEMPATGFEAANTLFEQGKFTEAASAYETLLRSGQISAAVYFNQGNAFFKAGEIGRAIHAYHQAQGLTPRDPDVRANLQFARNQVQGPTLPPPSWQRWLGRLSLNEWTWLAAGALWLWLLLLTLRQWRPALKSILRNYVLTAGISCGLLSAGCAAALCAARFTPAAIVTAREAVARQAPIEESPSVFTVHNGAELRVLDRKDDWLQVTTDPRRIGWLHRDQVLPESH